MRYFIVLASLTFLFSSAGPNFPSAASDDGGGTDAWVTVGNVLAEDGSFTVCDQSGDPGGATNLLTGTGFGFSIPGGSTIDGVEVGGKVKVGGSGDSYPATVINIAQLVYNGIPLGTNQEGGATPLSTTLTWYTYGGASNLLGATITTAIVNDASFGFQMAFGDNNGSTGDVVDVDAYKITVYYTVAGGATNDDEIIGFRQTSDGNGVITEKCENGKWVRVK